MENENLFKTGGPHYTRIFNSVSVAFGASTGFLLGKIVGYCRRSKKNICTKSQDDLAFMVGISASTCKRSLDKIAQEGIIFRNKKFTHIPQSFSVDANALMTFENNYRDSMKKFLEIEKSIINKATEEKYKECVVFTEKKGAKILRRYVNIHYNNGSWYAKITNIENKEYLLTEFEVF